jgi:hypothetical protein
MIVAALASRGFLITVKAEEVLAALLFRVRADALEWAHEVRFKSNEYRGELALRRKIKRRAEEAREMSQHILDNPHVNTGDPS